MNQRFWGRLVNELTGAKGGVLSALPEDAAAEVAPGLTSRRKVREADEVRLRVGAARF